MSEKRDAQASSSEFEDDREQRWVPGLEGRGVGRVVVDQHDLVGMASG